MKKMLNTLYVTSEDAYLALNGETVEIRFSDSTDKRVPLHTLQNVVIFSYKGASPALLGKCEELGIPVIFFSPKGRYLATVGASIRGNVLLRRDQFRMADNIDQSLEISRNMIIGKLYNSRQTLLRTVRDHALQVDVEKINTAAQRIEEYIRQADNVKNKDSLRAVEGIAASEYFGVFNELILQNKDTFVFTVRSRRPPLDRINTLMSFAYVLLAGEYSSALLSVGLDPYVGFFHTDRPGRRSLSLDLMEELRSVYADRFVVTLINNRIIGTDDFVIQDTGAVSLTDDGKRTFLAKWQERKRKEIMHPYLKEKMPWGMVPYAQAMLLGRYIRHDIDQYPPFFWR